MLPQPGTKSFRGLHGRMGLHPVRLPPNIEPVVIETGSYHLCGMTLIVIDRVGRKIPDQVRIRHAHGPVVYCRAMSDLLSLDDEDLPLTVEEIPPEAPASLQDLARATPSPRTAPIRPM